VANKKPNQRAKAKQQKKRLWVVVVARSASLMVLGLLKKAWEAVLDAVSENQLFDLLAGLAS